MHASLPPSSLTQPLFPGWQPWAGTVLSTRDTTKAKQNKPTVLWSTRSLRGYDTSKARSGLKKIQQGRFTETLGGGPREQAGASGRCGPRAPAPSMVAGQQECKTSFGPCQCHQWASVQGLLCAMCARLGSPTLCGPQPHGQSKEAE